ncbi:MAG: dihydrodipicolinate synthase family protein [Bacteroidales bacterium]|jgi:4-hydroxy-2-oxoglutarate aldolase
MIDLKGIYPPIPTSFTMSGDLDINQMQKNLEHLGKFKLAGFLVLGSNGETVMLSDLEKIRVYNAARKAIPGHLLMLAGTGGQSTREALVLTKEAANAGADAAVVLNPFYYKGLMTQEALVKHYHRIGDESPIPVIIYNMPANTGLDMTAETILAIADHPNIIGLKDSGGNIAKMGEIVEKAKPGFQVLAGSAGFLLPALSIGAVGGIMALANIAPQQCIDIHHFYLSGQLEKSRLLQISMITLNNMVTREQGVPALKAAMDLIGLFGGSCREPILPLPDHLRKNLAVLLTSSLT